MKTLISPRDLASAIAVSESSVKRWVDEGLIAAHRTAGGHRRIPREEAVRFIRQMRADVVRPDLLGFPEAGLVSPADSAAGPMNEALFRALVEGNAIRAMGLIEGPFLAGRPVAEIFDGPVRSAMSRVGELWQHSEEGIFLEHRATDICLQALLRIRVAIPAGSDDAPAAVGAAPAGDPYLLPSLMAATVLRDAGLRADNLGPNTPLEALRLAAEREKARLIWLSVSAEDAAEEISSELDEFAESAAARGTALVIGGRQMDVLRRGSRPIPVFVDSMAELAAFAKGLLTTA